MGVLVAFGGRNVAIRGHEAVDPPIREPRSLNPVDSSKELPMMPGGRSRRRFVAEMLGVCLAGPTALKSFAASGTVGPKLAPARKRLPNPYLENGKPVVVIVRGNDFPAMLAKGMELVGGFSRFGTQRSVIVKPNFVFDKKTRYPTTTDEASVVTTVRLLQREGFKDITVADRRGDRKNGRAGGKFDWSGLNDLADEGGFHTDSLMDDAKAPTVHVTDPRWTDMPAIGVIEKVYDAGLIINMPTLKRHTMTNLTCSLKNVMGVLDVPSTQNMHLWGEENKQARESMTDDEAVHRLCRTVAEAAMAVSPEMTVIDARQVLCTNHVSARTGEPREANRLIISGDSVAADVIAARVLKETYEPYDLGPSMATIQYAAKLGIGVADPSRMAIQEVDA
jgi:uncharacterized protein (DUF362 family)